MKHGLPDRAGRRDPASSVAQIALLFALPASLSRTRPSHPVSAWSFRNEFSGDLFDQLDELVAPVALLPREADELGNAAAPIRRKVVVRR